jgi:hypothetical protein
MILQELQAEFRCYLMMGGTKFNLEGWELDGQVAIATEESGVSFNHFKDCRLAIFYSICFKWLALQQAKGRTDRKDSKHKECHYVFLHTNGSLDKYIYHTVMKSKNNEQELIANLKGWIDGRI